MFNYQQICSDLLKDLPQNQREVISRRFGLKEKNKETLEAIGKDFSVTRERVRQIEKDGFLRLESGQKKYQKVFQFFSQYLSKWGGLKRENLFLSEMGGKDSVNQVFFLLNLSQNLKRFSDSKDFYPFWAFNESYLSLVKSNTASIYNLLKKKGKPLKLKEIKQVVSLSLSALSSVLEISKKTESNPEGLFGLKDWPEINPKKIKDKAFIVLKQQKRPLHFNEVANLIPAALSQTVHNELIKDSRFVLVGRGIYALSEWGYEKGVVKDIIYKILKMAEKPLPKDEIVKRVLGQRLVKENTILLNLSNRKYFTRDSGGSYFFKTS
ncbi:MAG: sigma factor-like helix-turn-helix DNA-binding protein [Candidatus Portnoybacteria bacterium]